jgi:hypothetical protein
MELVADEAGSPSCSRGTPGFENNRKKTGRLDVNTNEGLESMT